MTEQELHRANSIASRLAKLKRNLDEIEKIDLDYQNGKNLEFSVRTDDHGRVELYYQFLPIHTDGFFCEYKEYLKAEIKRTQVEFDEL